MFETIPLQTNLCLTIFKPVLSYVILIFFWNFEFRSFRETVEKVRKLSGLSKPGGARTENKYPSNGSMGSRSSSGSYPSSFPPAKTGVLHHLRDQFKIFSRLGDRLNIMILKT